MRDRDFEVFWCYAQRERSLDASLRLARKHGRTEEEKNIKALRKLNLATLIRETKYA